METLSEFVDRISISVCCYSHPCKAGYFSLKNVNTVIRGKMRVFGWVRELKRIDTFEISISTYKTLGDRSPVTRRADKVVPGMHFVSRKDDGEGAGTGIVFYIQSGSIGRDYQKTVAALMKIMHL